MLTETHKPTLLLIEDEEDDAFFFRRTFNKSGAAFSVCHVSNGAAAMDYLREAASANSLPRIIFLDLKMPVLNGFDVLSWMQKQAFPAAVPVVVLSGSEQQNDKDRARELGATAYMVKPVAVADFNRILREVIPEPAGTAPAKTGAQS